MRGKTDPRDIFSLFFSVNWFPPLNGVILKGGGEKKGKWWSVLLWILCEVSFESFDMYLLFFIVVVVVVVVVFALFVHYCGLPARWVLKVLTFICYFDCYCCWFFAIFVTSFDQSAGFQHSTTQQQRSRNKRQQTNQQQETEREAEMFQGDFPIMRHKSHQLHHCQKKSCTNNTLKQKYKIIFQLNSPSLPKYKNWNLNIE